MSFISAYSLSSILLSEWTLELRQRNSAAIAAKNISLPPIQSVTNILHHIHQTILVEMGDYYGIANAEEGDIISEVSTPWPDGVAQSCNSTQVEHEARVPA